MILMMYGLCVCLRMRCDSFIKALLCCEVFVCIYFHNLLVIKKKTSQQGDNVNDRVCVCVHAVRHVCISTVHYQQFF